MENERGRRTLTLPVLEQNDRGELRMAGGFCSTRDAVSEEELAALAELKRLHTQARQLKERLATTQGAERAELLAALETLRQEGALWRQRREEATRAKHLRLGNVTLALDG